MIIDSVHNLKCRSVSAGCFCMWLMRPHPSSTSYFIWHYLRLTVQVRIESTYGLIIYICLNSSTTRFSFRKKGTNYSNRWELHLFLFSRKYCTVSVAV